MRKNTALVLLACVHGLVHGSMNVFPVVIEPISQFYNWSITQVGAAGTAGYVLFGCMALPSGWIADYLRKLGFALCLLGITVGALMIVLVPWKWAFIAGWITMCLGAGLYHPIGLSSVATICADRTGAAMGWHGLGGNLGFAVMPLAAGIVADSWNWKAAFLTAAVPAALLLGLFVLTGTITVLEVNNDRSDTGRDIPWGVVLLLVLCIYAAVGFIYRGAVTFIPLSLSRHWGTAISLSAVGGLSSVVYLLGGIGQVLGGQLDEIGSTALLLLGIVTVYTVTLFIVPFAWGYFHLGLLMLWGLSYFAGQPVLNSLVSRVGDGSVHGRMYGLAFTMNLGLGGVASYICGWALDYWSFTVMFYLLGGVGMITLGLIMAVYLMWNRTYVTF